MNITYRDINTRKLALIDDAKKYPPYGIYNMYSNINESYSFKNARTITMNWESLSDNQNTAFSRLMDVFEAATYNDTEQNIEMLYKMINEGVLQKVRSGPQAQECMNRKIGKFKIQARKVKTRMRTANRHIPNTQAAAKEYEKTHKKGYVPPEPEEATTEDIEFTNFVENCYLEMINTSRKYDQCDRILLNNDKLNKRFNFDKTIREAAPAEEEEFTDCIRTLCEFIDTYNVDLKVKYNTALENIYYSLNRNSRPVSKEQILRDVTDYFLLSSSPITEESVEDIKYILTESKVYDMDDFYDVRYLFEDTENYIEEYTIINEAKKKDKKLTKKDLKSKPNSINEFKKSENKTVEGFRNLLNRIYNNSPENLGNDIGNIFTIIRYTFVVGAFGLNPVLGLVTLVTDFILKTEIGRKQIPKYIKKYKAEIKATEKAIDKAKDENETKRLKEYKKQLQYTLNKLEDQLDAMYSEKENEERHAKEDEEEANESMNFALLYNILENMSTIIDEKDASSKSLVSTIESGTVDDIRNVTEYCTIVPGVVNMKAVIEALYDRRSELRKCSTKDYAFIAGVNDCIETLENLKPKEIVTDNPITVCEYAAILRESIITAIDCIPTPDTITNINEEKTGLSLTSKLKVTLEKLRKAKETLSDKERTISKTIDVSVDNLQKNAERALTSSNREAVIRGTILPSASKCIKAALITGAAWALSPALAVIGLLGAIGASKKLQAKERQLILDDIDIELNMCERYMKMAEDKNDMQAQKHILQTQRELQRQKQRLQYNMQVKFREKTPPKASLGNAPGIDESFNITEEDLILERSGIKKNVESKVKKAERDGDRIIRIQASTDIDDIIKSHKGEIKVGKIKIKNPSLTKEDMLERPDKVREYLKEEGQDPYVNIGNAIGVLDFIFTIGITVVSSSFAEWLLIMLCKRIVKNILHLIKIAANAADPSVKVAVKTTRDSLLKYIHKLDVEIKLEKDPKKRAQLEKDREVLLSCYNETKSENHIEKKVI